MQRGRNRTPSFFANHCFVTVGVIGRKGLPHTPFCFAARERRWTRWRPSAKPQELGAPRRKDQGASGSSLSHPDHRMLGKARTRYPCLSPCPSPSESPAPVLFHDTQDIDDGRHAHALGRLRVLRRLRHEYKGTCLSYRLRSISSATEPPSHRGQRRAASRAADRLRGDRTLRAVRFSPMPTFLIWGIVIGGVILPI
jgi:hypothetical protein